MRFRVSRIHRQHMLSAVFLAGQLLSRGVAAQSFPLDACKGFQPKNVTVECASYRGRKAVRVTSLPGADAAYNMQQSGTGGGIVLLPRSSFHNGTIDVDVAAMPQVHAPALARGFAGIAFRVPPDATRYDYVYIRPTNGRADDQERRNHSAQYASFPNNEWLKLRKESPGKYESYVDLVPGAWTHLRIEINGVRMRLYVNRASQPTLLVNDLKLGDCSGAVALWIGVGTEAYFAHLQLKPQGK